MSSIIPAWFWIAPAGALLALAGAWVCHRLVAGCEPGNADMRRIAESVRAGAGAFLRRQYGAVAIAFAAIAAILAALAVLGVQNPFVPFAFLTGGFFSALCGFVGMRVATGASSRTAWAARESLDGALRVAFRAGAVMGLVVVGFGLLDICSWYFLLDRIYDGNWFGLGEGLARRAGIEAGAFTDAVRADPAYAKAKLGEITATMLTFGIGASTQSLFARVGGGIFTKAADIGADLVGKVEAGIPEDDPRNPATIADNVGDNVGDVAGMGADLYESYCGCILATAAIGASLAAGTARDADEIVARVLAPMLVAGAGAAFSLMGIFLVRGREDADQRALLRRLGLAVWVPAVGVAAFAALLCPLLDLGWGVLVAVATGLAVGLVIGRATERATSDAYPPTRAVAEAARMGPATAVIAGFGVGLRSVLVPTLAIGAGILIAFAAGGGLHDFALGLYCVAFAAVGMLATLGATLATDAFGPIADNAGGNAEMSGLGIEVRRRTDQLDTLGNTTAATGKGFAIGSAALTALALLVAYVQGLRNWLIRFAEDAPDGVVHMGGSSFSVQAGPTTGAAIDLASADVGELVAAFSLDLFNPALLVGAFLGAATTFVFSAWTMTAVGRAAQAMVAEVRRQFREIPGIMEGTAEPDHAACVRISTVGAQRAMVPPALLALLAPVATGLLLGVAGVCGLLFGALVTAFVLAITLNNAGGAWDNAKKYVEKGALGGRGGEVHKATVVGDTIGDPFKDTTGPSLNILVKIMAIVSLAVAGLTIAYGGWWSLLG